MTIASLFKFASWQGNVLVCDRHSIETLRMKNKIGCEKWHVKTESLTV